MAWAQLPNGLCAELAEPVLRIGGNGGVWKGGEGDASIHWTKVGEEVSGPHEGARATDATAVRQVLALTTRGNRSVTIRMTLSGSHR